jgi:hypothetical protein
VLDEQGDRLEAGAVGVGVVSAEDQFAACCSMTRTRAAAEQRS